MHNNKSVSKVWNFIKLLLWKIEISTRNKASYVLKNVCINSCKSDILHHYKLANNFSLSYMRSLPNSSHEILLQNTKEIGKSSSISPSYIIRKNYHQYKHKSNKFQRVSINASMQDILAIERKTSWYF